MNTIYERIHASKNIDEMARVLSFLTIGCAECSLGERDECEECLKDIIKYDLDALNKNTKISKSLVYLKRNKNTNK